MSGPRGFRYALLPVLLTRRWRCEQLQRDLGEVHAELRRQGEALDTLRRRYAAACAEWDHMARLVQGADTFLRYHRLLADLAEQEDGVREELRATQERRDGLIAELEAARRALDGIERHRMRMQREFLRERMNQEYKQNDDLWNARAALRAMP